MLPLAHRFSFDLLEAGVVNKRPADFALVDNSSALAVEFKDIAVLDQNNVLFLITNVILNELLVPEQHAILTVNRHDKLWPHCFSHDANIFLRSMTADVN